MNYAHLSSSQKLLQLFQQHQLEQPKPSHFQPIAIAVEQSDFVLEVLTKSPDLLASWAANAPMLGETNYSTTLAAALQAVENEADFYRLLRQFRQREMAIISFCQSNKTASVEQVFEHLSDLAEAIVLQARDWLFARLCLEWGKPTNAKGEVQPLLILGMGKLGGRELNFSSDIDLIFTYPESGNTTGTRKPLDNQTFFTRLGQRLIKALSEITVDGFVYRTDMRLRPFGDNGALVFSFAAMEDYYQEQGRDWERYAMIKAKILGDDPLNPNHLALKQLLRPFVYRRYLDFSAIQSLREMKQKISREVLRRGLTDNIKLGAGGIREVEFIVQTFQLIRGGRDKILQQRSLLSVLPQLVALQLLNAEQAEQLKQAYLFLRHIENSLQAIADQQTQTLPQDEINRRRLITASGEFLQQNDRNRNEPIKIRYHITNWQGFMTELGKHQANVRAIFNDLIGENEMQSPPQDLQVAMWRDWLNEQLRLDDLSTLLVEYPIQAVEIIDIFQTINSYWQEWQKRSIGIRGRAVLGILLPRLLHGVFCQPNPLLLLARVLKIIDKITTRTTYLELLLEKSDILPQLFLLCGQSKMIAEQIARYPMLLDELMIQQSLSNVIPISDYPDTLHQYLLRIPEEDEEQLLDALRQFKQSQILRIAAADILGVLPVMKVSDHLTFLAQAMIAAIVHLAWKQLTARFGTPNHLSEQQIDFTVIGYGKLGGIELGYNSDLDLVFLHTAPINGETQGGKRSISSQQFYIKLAQKIMALLSLNTSAGILYEVDMRLRPSGEAGLLVSTFDAFEQYQQREAWTWELQALVRSRCVFGSPNLQQRFEWIRQQTLQMPRESRPLRQDIVQMRQKMYRHLSHQHRAEFDLKADQGGIIDIEFIAQALVLEHAARFPQMAKWSDNVRIFECAIQCGILTASQGEQLKNSYTTLRNAIHHLNLRGEPSIVSPEQFENERAIIMHIWQNLLPDEK